MGDFYFSFIFILVHSFCECYSCRCFLPPASDSYALPVWPGRCAKKTQEFILVRVECPYVQFVAACVSCTTLQYGVTNGQERTGFQVSSIMCVSVLAPKPQVSFLGSEGSECVCYYITKSLKLKQINKHLRVTVELHLHRKMTGRHTPRTTQNLQGTPDNYLGLSSFCFNKASMSTIMIGTQQLGGNYMTCKAKTRNS